MRWHNLPWKTHLPGKTITKSRCWEVCLKMVYPTECSLLNHRWFTWRLLTSGGYTSFLDTERWFDASLAKPHNGSLGMQRTSHFVAWSHNIWRYTNQNSCRFQKITMCCPKKNKIGVLMCSGFLLLLQNTMCFCGITTLKRCRLATRRRNLRRSVQLNGWPLAFAPGASGAGRLQRYFDASLIYNIDVYNIDNI